MKVVCTLCGGESSANVLQLECPDCAGPLRRVESAKLAGCDFSKFANIAGGGVWRYRELLPLELEALPITLGEGGTPVVQLHRWGAEHGLSALQAKLEQLAPTGSFKDRGATLLFSALAAAGVQEIVEDSSGNAGAAAAAYAARAGMVAHICVPDSAPAAKVEQIAAYGAKIVRVSGSRQDVTDAALGIASKKVVYASHNLSPYFNEGLKTFAYELFEHYGAKLPDHIIFPIGNGGLLLGTAYGFADLSSWGLITRSPILHAAQAANCAPIVHQFLNGGTSTSSTYCPTIAGGVAVTNPPRMSEILEVLHSGGGLALKVGEEDIRRATETLAQLEGLFIEPTSAVSFAAATQLYEDGVIRAKDSVLIPVTGSGLKDSLARASSS